LANLYKYSNFPAHAFEGNVEWVAGDVKVALLADTYTPDQNGHEYWSEVSTHEVSGTGYTAGGQIIGNRIITVDGPTSTIFLSGDDVSWQESTITARYVVVYQDTGVAAASVLCGFADLGENKSSSNGDFNLNWSVSGIFQVIVQSP